MKKTIEIALQEYGITEHIGGRHNPRILQYFKDIGHQWVNDDEKAWCSAFANWVMGKAGYPTSGKLNARSWLKVGDSSRLPELGDIVVFWRESKQSWKGHVGFFVAYSEDEKHIYVLGGNQNNRVCVKAYPTYRLLGFRTFDTPPFRPIIDLTAS